MRDNKMRNPRYEVVVVRGRIAKVNAEMCWVAEQPNWAII